MKFNTRYKTILAETVIPPMQHVKFKCGRTIIDQQGWIYEFKDAPLSYVTKRNLLTYQTNFATMGSKVVFGKVYIVDRSGGREKKSYYITGTEDNIPFTYARIEGESKASSKTQIYFPKASYRATEYITEAWYTDTVSGEILYTDVHPLNTVQRFRKDAERTIYHRLDGPAIAVTPLGHELQLPDVYHINDAYYINGKQLPKPDFDAFIAKFSSADISTAIAALDI